MKVAPGGYRYGLVLVVAGAVAVLIYPLVGAALFALGAGTVWFHRDPDRDVPEGGIVAPADGTLKVLREAEDGRLVVGTFMNVHHVHVNRAPLPGSVVSREHVSGAHRPAFTKDSERNERVHLELDTPAGPTTVTQIAGAFARRIHPYVEEGDEVDRGERIGHISFGSRVDVRLPPGIDREDLGVERGDGLVAGESVLVPAEVLAADSRERRST